MFEKLTSFVKRTYISAAAQLAPIQPPKRLPRKQLTLAPYLKTATPSETSPLVQTDRQLANKDTLDYRTGSSTRAVLRDFVASSPDLSAAVAAALRTGITDSFTVVARNMDGTVNPEATALANQITANFNWLSDYSLGYADRNSFRTNSEMMGKELMTYGSCACELVLDKSMLPERIQPISTTGIKFYPTDSAKRLRPEQEISGVKIDLDVPTFFYISLDQDTLEPYSASPLEPAIQALLFSNEFMNDLRRVVKRAIHPRISVTIDEEKFRKAIPPDVVNDPETLQDYMSQVIADIEAKINGMEPEDAMIQFDTIGVEILDHGNTNLSNEWTTLQGIADSKVATATKTMPTILGHGSASANIASAEAMLYMKSADGMVRQKLNEMYSRIMTLAVRLFGQDVYVEFKYEDIDLRPKNEIESFQAMKQSRVLEQLSLGMITDEEACIMLTGNLPPAGYKPLMGTGFRPNTSVAPAGDGFNGATNGGSTMNKNLKSDAPDGGARGGNKKAEGLADVIRLG